MIWINRFRPLGRPSFRFLFSLIFIALAVPAQAAKPQGNVTTRPSAQERVLFLVQQPPQLKAAIMTGQQSLSGKGFAAREVEIVVCGPAISSLLKGSDFEPKLAEAKRAGIRVVACGLTLAEKNIPHEKVSSEVQIVDNGLVEALKRQAEGFRSVEL